MGRDAAATFWRAKADRAKADRAKADRDKCTILALIDVGSGTHKFLFGAKRSTLFSRWCMARHCCTSCLKLLAQTKNNKGQNTGAALSGTKKLSIPAQDITSFVKV